MTSKTVIRLIIGVMIAGSAAAALQLPTSSVSQPTLSSVPAKAGGGALAFPLASGPRLVVSAAGLKPAQVATRRFVP